MASREDEGGGARPLQRSSSGETAPRRALSSMWGEDSESTTPEDTSLDSLWAPEAQVRRSGHPPADGSELAALWDEIEDGRTSLRPGRVSTIEVAPEKPARPDAARKDQRNPVLTIAMLTVALMLLVLLVDGAYAAFTLSRALPESMANFKSAQQAFREGTLNEATTYLNRALENARESLRMTRRPSVVLASFLPKVADDARVARGLSQVAQLSARAGLDGVQAAKLSGLFPGDEVGFIASDGRVDAERLDAIQPLVAGAESLLGTADDLLGDLTRPTFNPIRDALRVARRELRSARATAGNARQVFESLPSLLGVGSSQRYFLAFQAPGEARATGGLLGLYGILQVHDGQIELSRIASANELPDFNIPVRGPQGFVETYGEIALSQWKQVNSSPDFPDVASVWLRMYERLTGQRLDGAIAMDPLALEEFLKATGPLTVEGNIEPIGAANVATSLMRDSYVRFEDENSQNEFLAAVVEAFWDDVTTGDLLLREAADALRSAVAEKHFQIYVRDDESSPLLEAFQADGSIASAEPNLQLIFNNNYSASKIDYFLYKNINIDIEIDSAGAAHIDTFLQLENRAPTGPPSLLLGTKTPGLNRMVLNVLTPENARIESFSVDGEGRAPFVYEESSHPVVWDILEIPSGESVNLRLSYILPGAVDVASEPMRFNMTIGRQPTVRLDQYTISLSAQPGARVVAADKATLTEDGRALWTGLLNRSLKLSAVISNL